VYSLRGLRSAVVFLAATFAICAGAPVLHASQDNNRSPLFNWLDSSVKAQTSRPSDGLPDFADIVDKVKPAVVAIRARAEEQTTGQGRRRSPEPQGDPFEEFFNAPKGSPGAQPRPRRSTAQGPASSFLPMDLSSRPITWSNMRRRSK
jgi:S1-C subfamily serine protease